MADRTFLTWPFFEKHHRTLHAALEDWCGTKLSEVGDHSELEQAKKFVSELGQAKFLELAVPGPYGGCFERLDVRSLCLAREVLARYSGLCDFSFAMQGLGAGPISLFGTRDQQKKYLPKVSSGELVAAFALSEQAAGSDVSALTTTAKLEGDHYILNGSKTWISNAGIADFYVVFARTGEGPGSKGLSAFIVDSDAPGFKVSQQIKVASPHPLGSLEFADCKISSTALIGKSGEGFKIAMATLDIFRSTVGAAALGFARRALDEALKHCKSRSISGSKLAEFQLTQDKLATMAVEIDAAALLIYRAAWTKDSGAARVTREAAMAKYFATEAAQRVIDSAQQLFGGQGVVSDHIIERLSRDIRPLRIYEGTSEVQKLIIANQVLKSDE